MALNHSLYLPYGGQRVDADTILIPTGDILANQPQSLNDFWTTPKQIGANFTNPDLKGNCGFNCTGYGQHTPPPVILAFLPPQKMCAKIKSY